MKYAVLMLTLTTLVVAIPGCQSTKSAPQSQAQTESDAVPQPAETKEAAATEEPLLLEDEPLLLNDEPLLLDDDPTGQSSDSEADNSRCHVCHINYALEKIATTHAKIGMGCPSCHGESDEHIADESWASGGNGTAPDKMFPGETINPFCMTCHTKAKIDEPQHAPVFTQGDKQKVCTDCHGEHRLPVRRCKWK